MPGFRFGKHPPKVDYRILRFATYVTSKLAAPPVSFNVLTRVYKNLKTTDPTKLFPMDGNDTLEIAPLPPWRTRSPRIGAWWAPRRSSWPGGRHEAVHAPQRRRGFGLE